MLAEMIAELLFDADRNISMLTRTAQCLGLHLLLALPPPAADAAKAKRVVTALKQSNPSSDFSEPTS